MKSKNKSGFIGLELVIVAAIVLVSGFTMLSGYNNTTFTIAQNQIGSLNIVYTDSGNTLNNTGILNNTEGSGNTLNNTGNAGDGDPWTGTPADVVVQVSYDANGYATILNIREKDITPLDDFDIALSLDGSGYVILEYTDNDKTVTIPQLYNSGVPVLEVGASAFYGLSVHTVALPSGIRKIGASAFSYSDLKTILIPDSVTEIGNFAFYSASKLQTVVFVGDVPATLGTNIFSECGKLVDFRVKVPAIYLADYRSKAANFGVAPSTFFSD